MTEVWILLHDSGRKETGISAEEIIDVFGSEEKAGNAKEDLIKKDKQRVIEEAEARAVDLKSVEYSWRKYLKEDLRIEPWEVK